MSDSALLKLVDAVTLTVPSLDAGIEFYRDRLGHDVVWRNDEIGQAAVSMPDADTEIVLTTRHGSEPNWLVDDVDHAVEVFRANGGQVIVEPHDIPVGRLGVVLDPFNNSLVLLDLSRGTYTTDGAGNVTGVSK